jgi:hypothetical protein
MAQLPIRLSIGGSHALQLGEANGSSFAQWRTNPLPLVRRSPQTPRQYLQRAELRAAQYAIAGSRFHSRWYIAVAGMIAVLMIAFASTSRARAQDQAEHDQTEHHHSFHKDFYSKWKEPGNPDASCCNARIEQDGKETGDCEPAKAEVRNGSWYVWIKQVKQWEMVYDTQIVRYPNPNIFDAHVCWTQSRGIICFKPPDTGG